MGELVGILELVFPMLVAHCSLLNCLYTLKKKQLIEAQREGEKQTPCRKVINAHVLSENKTERKGKVSDLTKKSI